LIRDGMRVACSELQTQPDEELDVDEAPTDWVEWLRTIYPRFVQKPFAPHHEDFWDWAWQIEAGQPVDPFAAIWARGGAKSSSAELLVPALACRGKRRYALYVRQTQENADKSVANIASLFEAPTVAEYYPDHAERQLTKHGKSRAWRRNRLWTGGGFVIDALGVDTAVRGAKVEEQRPDLIIIDDIDDQHDSDVATRKKLQTIKKAILPAGTPYCAVLFVQNLIIPHGVAAQLVDGRADMLANRTVSGPVPALRDLKTRNEPHPQEPNRIRAVIESGTPTWEGQGIPESQQLMDLIGLRAFVEEAQHEVHVREGALWKPAMFEKAGFRVDRAPPLVRIVVAVDPSGGGNDIGIGAAGLGTDGRGYVLADRTCEGKLGPKHWGTEVIRLHDEKQADRIVAEKNYGGDLVDSNIRAAASERYIPVHMVNASRGKARRAEPVTSLYEDGLVSHVGDFPELEREMTSWVPGESQWSPNRLDWMVWAFTELFKLGQEKQLQEMYVTGMRRVS
jgi:hypothetical protein